MSSEIPGPRPKRPASTVALGALLGSAIVWAGWPAWRAMAERWSADPRYAHGYLVPIFALYLLWARRGRLDPASLRPSWWGLPLIAAGLGLQLAGGYYYYGWFEALSILPTVAGALVLLAGRQAFRWSWPAVVFLGFMLPLPYRVEVGLSQPLQRVATRASTYALQTLGFAAVAEGNVIQLDKGPIEVVEACNGLGMLFTFVAMSTGVAMVIRRPWPDRAAIVASAIPIALIANVARIVVTGTLHELVGGRTADVVFHDLAGWLMMPLALGLMALELDLMARLFVEASPPATPGMVGAPAAAAAAPARGAPRAGDDAIRRALRAR